MGNRRQFLCVSCGLWALILLAVLARILTYVNQNIRECNAGHNVLSSLFHYRYIRNVDQILLGTNYSEHVLLHTIPVFPAAEGRRNSTLFGASCLKGFKRFLWMLVLGEALAKVAEHSIGSSISVRRVRILPATRSWRSLISWM